MLAARAHTTLTRPLRTLYAMAYHSTVFRVVDSRRPAGPGLRLMAGASIGLGLWAATAGAIGRPGMQLDGVVAEKFGALEWSQVWLWIGIAWITLLAVVTQQRRRGVLLAAWFGVCASLAAFRELDLHVILNPGNIHLIGLEPEQAVRFRMDWWLSSETPVGLRLAWAGVFAVVGAAVFVPFGFARYPWLRRLRRGDRFAWSMVAGVALLGVGFVADDLLRRVPGASLGEELVELAGQIPMAFAAAMLALRRVRLFSDARASREVASA